MKKIKRFEQVNESSEKKIKVTITLEMTEEVGEKLEGYYDTTSAKSAITQYIQELFELDGVTFKYDIKEE